jgi:hypothetical protein
MSPLLMTFSEYDRQGSLGEMGVTTRAFGLDTPSGLQRERTSIFVFPPSRQGD